jgi:hypothetical protein
MLSSMLAFLFCGATCKRQAAYYKNFINDMDAEKVDVETLPRIPGVTSPSNAFVHRSSRRRFKFEAKVHSIHTLVEFAPIRGGSRRRLGARGRFGTHPSHKAILGTAPNRGDKLASTMPAGASKNMSLLPDSVAAWAERRVGCGGLGELEIV